MIENMTSNSNQPQGEPFFLEMKSILKHLFTLLCRFKKLTFSDSFFCKIFIINILFLVFVIRTEAARNADVVSIFNYEFVLFQDVLAIGSQGDACNFHDMKKNITGNRRTYLKCDTIGKRINDTVYFPGGEERLNRFLSENNKFNHSKSHLSIKGVVTLRLYINQHGDVYDKIILRGIGGDIDEEALRLADLPIFLPATDSCGNAIYSEYILRVYFWEPVNINKIDDTRSIFPPFDFDVNNGKSNSCFHFRGGSRQMNRYFNENYDCSNIRSSGKVMVWLKVDSFGFLSYILLVDSDNEQLSTEAIRLIKSVDRWHPAINENQPINSTAYVKLKFRKNCQLKVRLVKGSSKVIAE